MKKIIKISIIALFFTTLVQAEKEDFKTTLYRARNGAFSGITAFGLSAALKTYAPQIIPADFNHRCITIACLMGLMQKNPKENSSALLATATSIAHISIMLLPSKKAQFAAIGSLLALAAGETLYEKKCAKKTNAAKVNK